MSGLEPVVFLAKGARVMLTMNLWSSVGLCNGATGTVVDIIYQNNHQPPDLPIAVIVDFLNYRGPVFNENQPLCIPICPITVTSQISHRLMWQVRLNIGLKSSANLQYRLEEENRLDQLAQTTSSAFRTNNY